MLTLVRVVLVGDLWNKMKKINIFPVFLIITGVLELLDNLNVLNLGWGKLWPIYLVLIGCVIIYNSYCE